MATPDPLFFITEHSVSNNTAGNTTSTMTISPVHFILNVIFVLVLLYLTLLVIRLIYRKTGLAHSHVLKEIPLGPTSKLQYINVGDKLYLLAQNGTQMVHLDTLSDPSLILRLLDEATPLKQPSFAWGTLLNFFKRNRSIDLEPEQFDTTLKKILQNSNKLEDMNNR